jgi:hypothetical protein
VRRWWRLDEGCPSRLHCRHIAVGVGDAGSLPATEAGSEPVVGAMAGSTDGAGGGPDIADTKLLGFLALPTIARRL